MRATPSAVHDGKLDTREDRPNLHRFTNRKSDVALGDNSIVFLCSAFISIPRAGRIDIRRWHGLPDFVRAGRGSARTARHKFDDLSHGVFMFQVNAPFGLHAKAPKGCLGVRSERLVECSRQPSDPQNNRRLVVVVTCFGISRRRKRHNAGFARC